MKHEFNTRRSLNLTDATARRAAIGTRGYSLKHIGNKLDLNEKPAESDAQSDTH